MGQRGHWDRPATARPLRPADYERASRTPSDTEEALRNKNNRLKTEGLQRQLASATNFAQISWGPRAHESTPSKDAIDDLTLLRHDPTESGNAD